MSPKEIETLQKYLHDARVYVEYGSGGSTCMASKVRSIEHICTIESNEKWIEEVKKQPDVVDRLATSSIQCIIIDIHGNPHHWGYPLNDHKKENWPLYSQAIREVLPRVPDLVLVDGRFRVACVVQVAMTCTDDTIICIHDYTDRPHYHHVHHFLELIEQVDTLAVFRRRKEVDMVKLNHAYELFKYDPR